MFSLHICNPSICSYVIFCYNQFLRLSVHLFPSSISFFLEGKGYTIHLNPGLHFFWILGDDISVDGDKCTNSMAEEEKFGCKISHLGHYSDISGKSMEKFVSAVSSYKFTSSGSRASGLRAPLRDVKNIGLNRSLIATDIGKFSYVSKGAKAKVKRTSCQRL